MCSESLQVERCSIEGCPRPRKYRDICGTHYERRRKTGSLTDPVRRTTEERFWQKVEIPDVTDAFEQCWLWVGTPKPNGYSQFYLNRSQVSGHRLAYRMVRGIIPNELELDHLCRTPLCVNPWHLEAVTHQVNVLRGESPAAFNAQATHCPQGHEYNEVNTRFDERGWRACRVCKRERQRERMRRLSPALRELHRERCKTDPAYHEEFKAKVRAAYARRVAARDGNAR